MPDSHRTSSSSDRWHHAGVAAVAATAATAATAAFAVRRQARAAERAHPPIGRFINVDGVALHYVERGKGPPVLLLHGNGVQVEDFIGSGLIDALARRHRVIAVDRPGFGYSERPRTRLWTPRHQADWISQALARLGVTRPVVVGHSWGTLVALEMALAGTGEASGLVLLSGYYYPTARGDVLMNLPGAIPLLGDVLCNTLVPLVWRLAFKRSVQLMFRPAPVAPTFLDAVPRELMLRPGQIRAASEDSTFMIPAVERLHRLYPQLTLPVTLIAGAGDAIVDVDAHSVRLHGDIPRSTLILAPGTGHMVHYGANASIVNAVETMTGTGLNVPGPGLAT